MIVTVSSKDLMLSQMVNLVCIAPTNHHKVTVKLTITVMY